MRRHWPYLLLFVYVALMATVSIRHEPWADEAQSWLIARDLGPVELLTEHANQFGHPPLWFFLLMIPAKLGLSYFWSLKIATAIPMVLGVWLLVRKSSLPVVLRVALPFSFFLFYQYAVIARAYCLFLPVLALLALLYPERHKRPVRYAGCLILLSLISVHGMLIAGALMVEIIWRGLRQWSALNADARKRFALAVFSFTAVSLALVLLLWPDSDHAILKHNAARDTGAFLSALGMLRPAFGGTWWIAAPALGISLVWFFRRGVLWAFAAPMVLLLAFFGAIYYSSWHEGILFLVWGFALWLSFSSERETKSGAESPVLRHAVLTAAILALVPQVWWSYQSFRYDTRHVYSGSREAAAYLREHGIHQKKLFAFGFSAVAVQPYFPEPIFANNTSGPAHAFELFGSFDTSFERLQRERPAYVLVAVPRRTPIMADTPPFYRLPPPPGYVHEREFFGLMFYQNRLFSSLTLELFRRGDLPAPVTE